MKKLFSYTGQVAFFLTLLNFGIAWSEDNPPSQNTEIHEGFLTKVSADILLDAYPTRPPNPINERIPRQSDSNTTWLAGYWAWNDQKDDFIWISGVWRRPPPSHQWIAGFWSQFEDGWVWIPGFWSENNAEALVYIDKAPPAALDEEAGPPPSEDQFWNPGYWSYNSDSEDFDWVEGTWVRLDPNWVLIPAHYTWRPSGYVFIPAYWDWPLDSLGQAYESVYIEPSDREAYVYEPVNTIPDTYIISHYFYYYPNYLPFYYHHFHYHSHFWGNFCCTPSWWFWHNWWGLSWNQHWGLWWWYSHPGYPAPIWITNQIVINLPEPHHELFKNMQGVIPPKFVSPKGIISPKNLLEESQKLSKKKAPIIPPGKKNWDKIVDTVKPEKGQGDLRPSGKGKGQQIPLPEKVKDRKIPVSPEPRIPSPPKKGLLQDRINQRQEGQPPTRKVPSRTFEPSERPPIRPKQYAPSNPEVSTPPVQPQRVRDTRRQQIIEQAPDVGTPPVQPQRPRISPERVRQEVFERPEIQQSAPQIQEQVPQQVVPRERPPQSQKQKDKGSDN